MKFLKTNFQVIERTKSIFFFLSAFCKRVLVSVYQLTMS